ncbi:MAG: PAS domain-containing sensor histidine kinase [Melioribacteraceae bacterium]|nr:PAS domain-containing sensor histidine kinase [Melioribacteraceae bacterium]
MTKKNNSQSKKDSVSEKVEEFQKIVQLLQIHQVELEHQNNELRVTQQELEISRNLYVSLFDFSPIPYFTLDENLIIRDVNVNGSKLFNIVRNRLINRNFLYLIPQKERFEFGKFIKLLFQTHEKQTCEMKLIHKNKKISEVIIEGIALENNFDSIETCQIAIIDFTNQKDFEHSLMESEKKLKASNDSKDRFFSILAHDLKSPFQSLLSVTELLANENESLSSEVITEMCNGLNSNLKNLYELVNNLLRWTMIQRDIIVAHPIVFPIRESIESSLDVIRISANNKNITIVNKVSEEMKVKCDFDMFGLIMSNLITNSVKFSHKGGEIIITASEKGDYIKISIADKGMGIDEEYLDKLFVFTAPYSTQGTQDEKGTELGLPLSKEFIEKNGGKIWVKSKEGEGSTFSFTLPKE